VKMIDEGIQNIRYLNDVSILAPDKNLVAAGHDSALWKGG
jgi:hypothetical protein